MSGLRDLPESVFKLIEGSAVTEFGTVSAAGVPIDTPTYAFPSDDLSTIDLATGLAYPAKAERARRNPKVGLLLEGGPGEPVVSIRGRAAVRDSDLQANAVRYVAETGFESISFGLQWSEAREAVWYWTRIIVEVTPERVLWWDDPAAMDVSPRVWNAPTGSSCERSDPTPAGKGSAPAQWPQRAWQEIAQEALARNVRPHLTLCDEDGYPLPIRASQHDLVGDRFRLIMPRGAPWQCAGKATLTFLGQETFVGDLTTRDGVSWLHVERALPQHPLMQNPIEVLRPSDDVKRKLMARLTEETSRRGQPIPRLPSKPPAPTRLAMLRAARAGGLAQTV
ncbi:MAG: pyridoxamine 5'-phosphate oxidase family protein [Aeromicrobium sp.]